MLYYDINKWFLRCKTKSNRNALNGYPDNIQHDWVRSSPINCDVRISEEVYQWSIIKSYKNRINQNYKL